MPIVGVITLYVSLLTFSLCVHPDWLDYADHILLVRIMEGPDGDVVTLLDTMSKL